MGGYDGAFLMRAARMWGAATENWSTTNRGASLSFDTTPNGSTAIATRMTITHDGNVGIGTASPASLLQVAGGIQLGDDTATCPGASNIKVGTLRFNSGALQLCLTSGWGAHRLLERQHDDFQLAGCGQMHRGGWVHIFVFEVWKHQLVIFYRVGRPGICVVLQLCGRSNDALGSIRWMGRIF